MPQAFTDVAELDLFANRLLTLANEGVKEAVREFTADALDEASDWMYAEAPSDEGELRRSITVELDADGMGGTVGPTAVDEKGRPYPFFVEFGTSDTPPNPFVHRTAKRLEAALPKRAQRLLEDIL